MANREVIDAMNKDRRTTREYFEGYIETIDMGNKNALAMEISLDRKEIEKQADLVIEQTHMAGNPIYSRDFRYVSGKKKIVAYDRAKTKQSTKKAIDEYDKLSDEELESLTF